jgi:hypothetical protein
MSLWRTLHLLALPMLLAACAATQQSQPIAPEAAARGIQLVRALPEALPSQLSKVPDSQYLLVFAESTTLAVLDNLNPLPFSLTSPIAGAYQDQEAAQLKNRYASVDPYLIAAERLQGSPLLTGRADALRTMPLVYLVQDNDDVFRATLVLRAEGEHWMGRYLYHLPTTHTDQQVKTAGPEMLASLHSELQQGTDVLRGLMERDARGELKGDGRKVQFGSLHIVGSRVGAMMPATMVHFPDAEVIEEGPDHVVLRAAGNPASGAREGALAFGVHHFRRDQLHTFKPM